MKIGKMKSRILCSLLAAAAMLTSLLQPVPSLAASNTSLTIDGQVYELGQEYGGNPNHDCHWTYDGCDHELLWDCPKGGVDFYVCRECGRKWVSGILSPIEHRYVSKVTKEATETTDGVVTYVCENCGKDSFTRPILHGQSYKVEQPDRCEEIAIVLYGKYYVLGEEYGGNPDHDCHWTYDGCDHKTIWDCPAGAASFYICRTCGKMSCSGILSGSNHDYRSVTDPVTGTVTYTCSKCNDSYTEGSQGSAATGTQSAPQHQHTWKTTTQAATCTAAGQTVQTCTVCGQTGTTSVLNPLGHSYTPTVTKQATATQDGVRTYVCSRCGDRYEEKIPATGGSSSAPAGSGSFSDVPSNHWAKDDIERAAIMGFINGMGDGRFNPDGKLTYAEFANVLVKAFFPSELQSYS